MSVKKTKSGNVNISSGAIDQANMSNEVCYHNLNSLDNIEEDDLEKIYSFFNEIKKLKNSIDNFFAEINNSIEELNSTGLLLKKQIINHNKQLDKKENKISELQNKINLYELESQKKQDSGKKDRSIKKSCYVKVDSGDDKYITFLKFLNDLLKVMNKPPIDDITGFNNILKSELVDEKCKKICAENLDNLCIHFSKTKIRYMRKDSIDGYIVTLVKNITLLLGYNWESRVEIKYTKVDGKFNRGHYNYLSIV